MLLHPTQNPAEPPAPLQPSPERDEWQEYGVQSSPVAQPFWGRFFRALLLVLVAAMAHLSLVQERQQSDGANAAAVTPDRGGDPLVGGLDGRVPAELTDARFGGSSSNVSAVGSTGTDAVQVITQLVPVSTTGSVPSAPAPRPAPGATMKAELTSSPTAVSAPEKSLGEPVVMAAGKSEEPADRATGEDVPVTAALQSQEPPANTLPALMPLAAARRLPDPERRIAPPAARSSSKVTERAIAVAPIVEPDQKLLVSRVLQQYALAYERLDVEAAKAVYPSIDGTALRRAFGQLEAQRVTFESCGITISGQDANARCQGEAAYRPRIGPRSLHRASREWTFNLAKADDGWQIVKATMR